MGFVRVTIVVIILLVLSEITCTRARHITRQHSYDDHYHSTSKLGKVKGDEVMSREMRKGWKKHKRAGTLQVAGSTLPDCSHACGSCTPCRLVVVSFVCATIQEAETCPVSYKCMCNNKSYPVP